MHNEREEVSAGILSNPGDCDYHSGGVSFAVGTLILQDKSNQQQSILLYECFPDVGEWWDLWWCETFQVWKGPCLGFSSNVWTWAWFCYCFGWHIVISFAYFLFLSMLVIKDICSSLPQPVHRQLSALKCGIDLVLSCYVRFFNGK